MSETMIITTDNLSDHLSKVHPVNIEEAVGELRVWARQEFHQGNEPEVNEGHAVFELAANTYACFRHNSHHNEDFTEIMKDVHELYCAASDYLSGIKSEPAKLAVQQIQRLDAVVVPAPTVRDKAFAVAESIDATLGKVSSALSGISGVSVASLSKVLSQRGLPAEEILCIVRTANESA